MAREKNEAKGSKPPLAASYILVDQERSAGVVDRLYKHADYNEFSKIPQGFDLESLSIIVSSTSQSLPDPISGKRIRLPNGSVSTPALSWVSDTDTGLYYLSSGAFGVSQNGALGTVFDSTGLQIGGHSTRFNSAHGIEYWKDQNAFTQIGIVNQSSGGAASAAVTFWNDGGNQCGIGISSSGWTSGGGILADEFAINTSTSASAAPSSIAIIAGTAIPIIFRVNATEAGRFTSAGAFALTGMTQGSIPFFGASGVVTQDNSNFFLDATNIQMGIGTNAPSTFGSPALDLGGRCLHIKGAIGRFILEATTGTCQALFWDQAQTANERGALFEFDSNGFRLARFTDALSITDIVFSAYRGVSGFVINEAGTDRDTRIEGDNATSLFLCDASVDRVSSTVSDASTTPIYDFIQSSTGDSAARFAIGSTTSWAVGADNSDSDKFKVSYAASGSAVLGTNDYLTITSAGLVTFSSFAISTLTEGSVLFAGASGAVSQDNANLFFDDTQNFLGIGINASLAAPLHISASHATTTPQIIINQASTGDTAMRFTQGTAHSYIWGIDATTNAFVMSYAASGSAVLGTGDVMAITTTRRVGLDRAAPDAKLEVLDNSGTIAQLRLTHTSTVDYADFTVDTDGLLNVAPSSTGGVVLFGGASMYFADLTAFPSATYDGYCIIGRTRSGGSAPFDQAGSLIFRSRVSSTAGRGSIYFYTGSASAQRIRITEAGDVLLGTNTGPSAGNGKVLVFGDNAAQPTMGSNTCGLYGYDSGGGTVEVYAVDEAGNDTQLSPHDENGLWYFNSINRKTGRRLKVHLERLVKYLVEKDLVPAEFIEETVG